MTGDNREPPEEGVFLKLNEVEGVSEKNLTSGRRSPVEIRCVSSDSSSRGSSSSLSSSSSSLVPSSDSDAVVGLGGGGGGKGPRHAAVSVIGRRREMEDAVTMAPGFSEGYDFYGVYDGHGGARVAHVCRERMHVVLAEEVGLWGEEGEEWREAMAACFARVDGEVAAESPEAEEWTVGSTAVVAVVSPKRIVVANCGDSRAVLSRGGVAIPLSNDHKPERADELERVEAAGGRVINWNGYRILGVLATSRSIGDCYLKPYVISEPEVMVIDRNEKDEFIILASDGLWDVVSNEVACRVARQFLSGRAARIFPEAVRGCSTAEAAELLVELALSRGSRDNISVVVVELKRLLRNRTSRGSS